MSTAGCAKYVILFGYSFVAAASTSSIESSSAAIPDPTAPLQGLMGQGRVLVCYWWVMPLGWWKLIGGGWVLLP